MPKLTNLAITIKRPSIEICQQIKVEVVKGTEGRCYWPPKLGWQEVEAGKCYYLF